MEILLNGESTTIPEQITAFQLLEIAGLAGKRVAMEVNCEIVPRSTYETYSIQSGDKVEIVRAIGGG
jgi:sulfur carrier protein